MFMTIMTRQTWKEEKSTAEPKSDVNTVSSHTDDLPGQNHEIAKNLPPVDVRRSKMSLLKLPKLFQENALDTRKY